MFPTILIEQRVKSPIPIQKYHHYLLNHLLKEKKMEEMESNSEELW